MKVIAYTLTVDGEIPNYVIDGGYFLKNESLIGIATDDAPESAIATKTDLQKYAKDLEAPSTLIGENPTMADLVSAWWDEKVTW